jgi:ectoine hydroxylase-related dioxygenase (phytanoyl-CoA dioxygenase family)
MIDDGPPSYGILKQRSIKDKYDSYIEEIYYLGYTVVPSGLRPDDLNHLRKSIDRYYREQSRETGETAALGAERDILRCPLSYDDSFLRVATLPSVLEVARRVLGENVVLLQQNGIINQPNLVQYQSRWHRDLPYQHFVSSQKLAVNALLCVDDFTFDTGGTFVLPGSQMFEEFPSARLVSRWERVVEAAAGSVIMMDAMLYHRAGTNVSAGARRGVNHVIGKPLLSQQIDIPRLIGPRFANDPFLSRYLGYYWNPAADVQNWRAKRFDHPPAAKPL